MPVPGRGVVFVTTIRCITTLPLLPTYPLQEAFSFCLLYRHVSTLKSSHGVGYLLAAGTGMQ